MEYINVDDLIGRLKCYNHTEVHIHHTWRPNHSNFDGGNHMTLQENMRHYHVSELGWSDIGQHVTLFPDGSFVTGRDFGKVPSSIYGKNGRPGRVPFAIEMLGDFDCGNDVLQGEQLRSILKVCKFFNDQGKYVRFHRENSDKTCPGTGIDKEWFMNMVINFDEKFTDIKGHWAEAQIKDVLQREIMNGRTDGQFHPDAPLTRAEFAYLISTGKLK